VLPRPANAKTAKVDLLLHPEVAVVSLLGANGHPEINRA
jgi:hypothetical protein